MSLKTEREKRGLTQTTVAKAMGMRPGAYNVIETGDQRKPTKQHRAAFRMAMRLYDMDQWPEVLAAASE